MTRSLLLAALLLFTASCNSNKTEPAEATTVAADTTASAPAPMKHEYATKAWYSSEFAIGDVNQGDIVVDLWKQFDDNTLDNALKYFADSVNMSFSDGTNFKGTKEGAVKMAKGLRGNFSSFKTTIAAIVPLKSTDKNENWVSIWGTEYTTMKGKADSTDIQENWMFDKNGKVAYMHNYSRKMHK
jgi:hypothetical protein